MLSVSHRYHHPSTAPPWQEASYLYVPLLLPAPPHHLLPLHREFAKVNILTPHGGAVSATFVGYIQLLRLASSCVDPNLDELLFLNSIFFYCRQTNVSFGIL